MSKQDEDPCFCCPINNRCKEDDRRFYTCANCEAYFCMVGIEDNLCPECGDPFKEKLDVPATKRDLREVIEMVKKISYKVFISQA